MERNERLMLFCLDREPGYAERVAAALGVAVSPHEERTFEDGECKCRPTADVARADAFVLQCLSGDAERSVHDKLCQLLFFVATLRDAGAERVTAIVPYLGYARKDQRTQFQDPVATRYVGMLLEAVGTAAIMTLDVHNIAAFQNAFRCQTLHLSARDLFVETLEPVAAAADTVVVAPDFGAAKRAEELRRALAAACGREPGMALVEKYRSRGVISGSVVAGDLHDRTAILFDDMLSSGNTLRRAAQACRDNGAVCIVGAVTHALRQQVVEDLLDDGTLDRCVVADTIPAPWRARDRLQVVDTTPLVARAIRKQHTGSE